MNIAIQTTLFQIQRCIPDSGRVGIEELRKMYGLTLRLQSQLLGLIYDMEIFPRRHSRNRLHKRKATASTQVVS